MQGRIAAVIGVALVSAMGLTGCGDGGDGSASTVPATAETQADVEAIANEAIDKILSEADGPKLVLTAADRAALSAYSGTMSTMGDRFDEVQACANAQDVDCVNAKFAALSSYASRQIIRLKPITRAVDLPCLRASGQGVAQILNHYVTANSFWVAGDSDSAIAELMAGNDLAGENSEALNACTEAHTP